jgi:lysophospholipase L1-like esterase
MLIPFAANEQLRFQYMQTVLGCVAKVVPPRVVFLGDSNTAGGGSLGWRVLGNPISAINLGVSNYTIRQVAFMVPRAVEYRPSVVVIMAGTNDILANHASVEQIRLDFDFLMDALARAHEKSVVTLIPLSSEARFTPEIEAANAFVGSIAEMAPVARRFALPSQNVITALRLLFRRSRPLFPAKSR